MPDNKENFYLNEKGFVVFTEEYHLQRGYCCGNGCIHCPYAYKAVAEPKRTELLLKQKERLNTGD